MLKFKKGQLVEVTDSMDQVITAVYDGADKFCHRVIVTQPWNVKTDRKTMWYLTDNRFIVK